MRVGGRRRRALRAAGGARPRTPRGTRSSSSTRAARPVGGWPRGGSASATLDHGAQFFTVRSEAFAAMVQGWERDGLVDEWCRGFASPGDGYPRYVVRGGHERPRQAPGRPGSTCAAAPWSSPSGRGRGWLGGRPRRRHRRCAADAVVVTCPLPQTASLLITREVTLPERLRRTDYDRTLALLAVARRLARPSPAPGGVQSPDAAVLLRRPTTRPRASPRCRR